jgi:hypothetical protein
MFRRAISSPVSMADMDVPFRDVASPIGAPAPMGYLAANASFTVTPSSN